MRGRKPKPVEQRIAEGNPGKRALPRPVRLAPGAPVTLNSLPAAARKAWDLVVPVLVEAGVIDELDSLALEALVTQYARMVQARQHIARHGFTVQVKTVTVSPKGRSVTTRTVVNPAIKTERDASLALLRMAESYGLDPVARVRLGLSELKRQGLQAELAKKYPAPQPERKAALDAKARPS